MRTKTRLLPAVALAAAALLACRSTPVLRSAADEIGRAPPPDAVLRIFATGETRGFLGPCGCEEKQHGGFARRATYLRGIARGDDLRIDLGNAASGRGPLRELRLTATLDALARTGYDVVVPGRLEVELGAAFETAARAQPALHVVCANLVDDEGKPVFPAAFVHVLGDGRRVGVVGVTDDHVEAPPGRRVTPAGEAVRRAIVALGGVDAVVVAAALPRTRMTAVTMGAPSAAIVLASSASDDTSMMMSSGRTDPADEDFRGAAPPLVTVGDFGAYVRRVDLGVGLRALRTWRAWLGDEVADDGELAGVVKQFRQDAIALDPDLVPDIWKGLAAGGFAGSAACAPCHAEDHATWAASLHGRAMRILVERDANRDPECVPCHLVDLPAGGVRDTALADDLGVGCEACHGGRAQHVEDARAKRLPADPPDDGAREGCKGCHHPPEVTHFDFDESWPKIEHGD